METSKKRLRGTHLIMTRKRSLICALLIILTAVYISPAQADEVPPPENLHIIPAHFRAFSENSPWNSPIPANPDVSIYSPMMITRLKSQVYRIEASTNIWTVPIFFINSAQSPKMDIPSTSGELFEVIDPDDTGIARNVPIPEGIWSDPEADGHMVLVDPIRYLSWEFTRARKDPDGRWTASIIDRWDLRSSGYRPAFSGRNWWRSGACAAGMPLIAGVIRPEEIAEGEIRHALLCATPINRKSMFEDSPLEVCAPPASRSDGQGIGLDFIPMGARIQLDPALNLDTLGLSPGSRMIARAMQHYGLIVGMSAPTFKVFCQNLGPESPEWDSYQDFSDLERIPLNRFRVLACDLAYN